MANNAEELGLRLYALCHTGNRGNPPSHAAEIQSLIAKGANVNTRDQHGDTVLHRAVMNGYLSAVLTLLATEGIDIRAKNNYKATVLMYACRGHNVEIVKALLAALKETPNFDINDKDIDGDTALIRACMWNRVEVIKLLLSIPRINTHLKNNEGLTALDFVKGRDEIRALFQGKLLPHRLRALIAFTLTLLLSCSHNLLSALILTYLPLFTFRSPR
jgi:ankyrin repeat protein